MSDKLKSKDEMIGKTIEAAQFRGFKGYLDVPYLDIKFTDGSTITIRGYYGVWVDEDDGLGKTKDEYPEFLQVGEQRSFNMGGK